MNLIQTVIEKDHPVTIKPSDWRSVVINGQSRFYAPVDGWYLVAFEITGNLPPVVDPIQPWKNRSTYIKMRITRYDPDASGGVDPTAYETKALPPFLEPWQGVLAFPMYLTTDIPIGLDLYCDRFSFTLVNRGFKLYG